MYSSSLLTIPEGIIISLLLALFTSLIIWFSSKLFKKNVSLKKLFKNFSIILIVPYVIVKIAYYLLGITGNLGQLYILPMLHFVLILILSLVIFSSKKKLQIHKNK